MAKEFQIFVGSAKFPSRKQTLKYKKACEMNIQYKIRKSRPWAFNGKNYQAIDNQGEFSPYPKKQPRTLQSRLVLHIEIMAKNSILSLNGMVDDSNNYVNPASEN